MRRGVLAVISGYSGVGKGTMVKQLISNYEGYALSISATTRAPRVGEVDGENYFFITKEEFEKRIDEEDFLEYAQYVENYYGTPKSFVEKKLSEGKDVILEIETKGAAQIKKLIPDAITIFIMPPSAEELRNRLVGRGTETQEVIEKRLSKACEESGVINDYDFVLVNDKIDESVKALDELIKANHAKTFANIDFINKIKEGVKSFSKGE